MDPQLDAGGLSPYATSSDIDSPRRDAELRAGVDFIPSTPDRRPYRSPLFSEEREQNPEPRKSLSTFELANQVPRWCYQSSSGSSSTLRSSDDTPRRSRFTSANRSTSPGRHSVSTSARFSPESNEGMLVEL